MNLYFTQGRLTCLLARFRYEVEIASAQNYNDHATLAEEVVRDLLNIIYTTYGWNLKKAVNPTQKGYDLIDTENKIVVQVKAKLSNVNCKEVLKKIQDTLVEEQFEAMEIILFGIADDVNAQKKITADIRVTKLTVKLLEKKIASLDTDIKKTLLAKLEEHFGDFPSSSNRYYYTYQEVMYTEEPHISKFGFPCEVDFIRNKVWTDFSVIKKVKEKLEQDVITFLVSASGRGKTVFSKIIARQCNAEGYDILFFDLLQYTPCLLYT
ncbi:MAG: SMEK domain-containing protein, partial [Ferruginibacter sp.]